MLEGFFHISQFHSFIHPLTLCIFFKLSAFNFSLLILNLHPLTSLPSHSNLPTVFIPVKILSASRKALQWSQASFVCKEQQMTVFSQFLCPNWQGVCVELAVWEENMNETCKKCCRYPEGKVSGRLAGWPSTARHAQLRLWTPRWAELPRRDSQPQRDSQSAKTHSGKCQAVD